MILKLYFGLNEVKLRATRVWRGSNMEKASRSLKIVRWFSGKQLPHLSLKGRWLERAGFTIGMRVEVLVKDQCLIVLPSKPPEKKT